MGLAVSYERGTPVTGATHALRQLSSDASDACFFFFFFTRVSSPRRSLRLKLRDTRVYELPTHASIFAPLSSQFGTYKTVTARFWPQLSGKSPSNLPSSLESGLILAHVP